MIKLQEKPSFWIKNISKKGISLGDLNISIQPNISINLLDSNRYPHLDYDKLIASSTNGSLFKKQRFVVIRKVPPTTELKQYIPLQKDAVFLHDPRSAAKIEEIHYDELNISDDDYANENAEMAQSDSIGHWSNKK